MFLEDVLLKYIVAFAVLISLLISGSSAVEWDRRQGNHPPRPRRSRCYYRIDAPPGIGPLNWYRVTVELEGPIWKEKCNRHDFMLPQLTAFNDAFDARSESGSRSNFGGRDFRTYWEKKGQGHCKVMLWTQNIDWIPGFFECFAPEGAGGPTECLPKHELEQKELAEWNAFQESQKSARSQSQPPEKLGTRKKGPKKKHELEQKELAEWSAFQASQESAQSQSQPPEKMGTRKKGQKSEQSQEFPIQENDES